MHVSNATPPPPMKRALVLSGGGSKGPYHVGFCRRAIGELGIHYPILCGVSVGALVAGFLAMYHEGEEATAATELDALFLGIENRDVWKRWFLFGKVAGLWKPSLLNSAPLEELVENLLDASRVRASGKLLRIGAVSLGTGEYRIFDENYVPLHRALLASASFPGFFLPVKIGADLWIDGGIQQVTPIKAAIAAGATAIDVVITDPEKISPGFEADPEAPDVLLRTLEIMVSRLTWVDVRHALAINELVRVGAAPGKRHLDIRVVAPTEALNSDPLNFDPREATAIAATGYRAARELESGV